MLGWLGFQLTSCRNERHQCEMHIDSGIARQVIAELTDRFHERHGFNIAHGAADFAENKIIVLIAFGDESFDLVRHMRNDLNRGS